MSQATILVADDDRAIRTVLNQALGRLGYDVRTTGHAGGSQNLRLTSRLTAPGDDLAGCALHRRLLEAYDKARQHDRR